MVRIANGFNVAGLRRADMVSRDDGFLMRQTNFELKWKVSGGTVEEMITRMDQKA